MLHVDVCDMMTGSLCDMTIMVSVCGMTLTAEVCNVLMYVT